LAARVKKKPPDPLFSPTEMEAEFARRLSDFNALRASGEVSARRLNPLIESAATAIISYFDSTGKSLRDAITLLCEITSLPAPELSRLGIKAMFSDLIERLNDSFRPLYCHLYNCIFAQVISFYRALPEGRLLDEKLNYFSLPGEAELLARRRSLSQSVPGLSHSHSINKVIVLSRVTVGADVAVTSVIMGRVKQAFPRAQIVLMGSPKLKQLFGGDERIRVREVGYGRSSGVISRLNSWLSLVEAVEDELRGVGGADFYIFDPDSRLTQLGLLPLLSPELEPNRYLFFESRTYHRPDLRSLGELTSAWLDELFQDRRTSYPFVAPDASILAAVSSFLKVVRRTGASHLTCVSFGVGGNMGKRVSPAFEAELIKHLSLTSKLIIDRGATKEEQAQIDQITETLRQAGLRVLEVDESNVSYFSSQKELKAEIIAWQGGIGAFASLIANSDEYIGYDSSGQHIAAALSVPSFTLFVSSNSRLFAERWHPYGPGITFAFFIKSSAKLSDDVAQRHLLKRVLSKREALLKAGSPKGVMG
jgi:ADP-heptose:LPS heptosyltransferase